MSVLVNSVRSSFYLDSVALMRVSRTLSERKEVDRAALMIGTPSNKEILDQARLLDDAGRDAGPNDLVIAVRLVDEQAREQVLAQAEQLLDAPAVDRSETGEWHPKSMATAMERLPEANLALISVPGEYAAREARRALRQGLHTMIFSDNVSLDDECSLKEEARSRGLLLMGPDCGTALIGGVPLAFANEVPRGSIGIIAASGTGLQEVSSLIAREGEGVSHGIGVGGRDLSEQVGGIMTLEAIDALDQDPETDRIVLISKPPAARVADAILGRVARSPKPFTITFIGGGSKREMPDNAVLVSTLKAAADCALGFEPLGQVPAVRELVRQAAASVRPGRARLQGLYSGGTLCAEAQVVLRDLAPFSNVPIPGAGHMADATPGADCLLDLGADEYTVGRPHPMIDPAMRVEHLRRALLDPSLAVVLLDVVIGHGAHADPSAALIEPPRGRRERCWTVSDHCPCRPDRRRA